MQIKKLRSLLGKLLLALLAFPPVYLVVKYLRWCGKENCKQEAENTAES